MSHPYRGSAKDTSRTKFKAISGQSGRGSGTFGDSQLKTPSDYGVHRRAQGGRATKVNINIISNPRGREQVVPPPLTPAAPMGAAAVPVSGPLPFPPPGGGAPIQPRKRGGLVKMTGGAEGGLGRLQKARNAKTMRGG